MQKDFKVIAASLKRGIFFRFDRLESYGEINRKAKRRISEGPDFNTNKRHCIQKFMTCMTKDCLTWML